MNHNYNSNKIHMLCLCLQSPIVGDQPGTTAFNCWNMFIVVLGPNSGYLLSRPPKISSS